MADYRISIIVDGKDHASGMLRGVQGALSNVAQIAGGIVTAGVFNRLVDGFKSMAAGAYQATADFQAMQIGLESLVAREMVMASATQDAAGKMSEPTLKMAEAFDLATPRAKELMAQIEKIAVLSPFSMQTVQGTFRQAMAFGYTSDEATKFTAAMMDVAAGTGASNELLERMGYNLAQIRMVGKITAVDMRQLAMAGFDLNGVLKFIGRELNLNIQDYEDFNVALERGQVSWEQFTDLFAKYAKENFGGASEKMSRTLNGLKSTFGDLFMLTMPKLLGPAAEKFTDFANNILNQVLEIRESGALEEWGEKIGNSFDWLKGAGENITRFIKKAGVLWGVVANFGVFSGAKTLARWLLPKEDADEVIAGIDGLQQGFENGLTNIRKFWEESGPSITENLGRLWEALSGQGKIDIDVEAILTSVGKAFETGTQWIKDNGPSITETVKNLVDKLLEFGAWVKTNKDDILAFITGFAAGLAAVTLSNAGGALITTLSQMATHLAGIAVASGPLLLVGIALGLIVLALQQYGEVILGADAQNANFFQKAEVGFWGLLLNASTSATMLGEIIKVKFSEMLTSVQDFFQPALDKIREMEQAGMSIAVAFQGAIDNVRTFLSTLASAVLPDWAMKVLAMSGASAVQTQSKEIPIPGKAGGGGVFGGQSYWVGEKGPEIFKPRGDGSIIPNHQLAGALAGAGAGETTIFNVYATINNDMDAEELTQKIAAERRYRNK